MKQITIIVDDPESYSIATITGVLAQEDINIEDIDAEALDRLGVITLIVDRQQDAIRALRDAGFAAATNDTVVLELDDVPGALAKVSAQLRDANIQVRSMRIVRRDAGKAVVISVVDKPEEASELLGAKAIA